MEGLQALFFFPGRGREMVGFSARIPKTAMPRFQILEQAWWKISQKKKKKPILASCILEGELSFHFLLPGIIPVQNLCVSFNFLGAGRKFHRWKLHRYAMLYCFFVKKEKGSYRTIEQGCPTMAYCGIQLPEFLAG